MKIAVLSDTHGDEQNVRWLLEQVWKDSGPIDAYLHLGDGVYDFNRLQQFIRAHDPSAMLFAVRGNCDIGVNDEPETRVVRLGGVGLFMSHGHRYYVKQTYDYIDRAAQERGCAVALFGHTHVQTMEMRSVLLLNPGSATNDRMALIEIDEKGDIRPHLIEY